MYTTTEEINCMVHDDLAELRKTRDLVDKNLHDALTNCVHGTGIVFIGKIETLDENDIAIQVSITDDIKHVCNSKDLTCVNAFVCKDLIGLKNYICNNLVGNVVNSKQFSNDTYVVSRYQLKKLVNDVGKNLTQFNC